MYQLTTDIYLKDLWESWEVHSTVQSILKISNMRKGNLMNTDSEIKKKKKKKMSDMKWENKLTKKKTHTQIIFWSRKCNDSHQACP